MRTSFFFPVAALLGLGLLAPTLVTTAHADGRANRPDVLSVTDIKKGMKGYGLTVFEGTKPERFDVEVIDVLKDFRPHQEMILVKTYHPRLEVAKIVAGMSGSPIYFNGKMAGAYAYGWSFGVEPVAGVTPIRNMLDDLERPLPKTLRGAPLGLFPPGKLAERTGASEASRRQGSAQKSGDYDAFAHAALIGRSDERSSGSHPRLQKVATPLLLSGLSDGALGVAEELLSPLGIMPVQAGGSAGKSSGARGAGYVDGGAIGVTLVRGDISAMGLGTVTRVEGDKLVAFGHPMMQVGITALPTTEVRVLWFMASVNRSFKMGEAIGARGTLVNDRQSSIVVDQSVDAMTVPVHVRIRGAKGAPYKDWDMEVAHDQFVTPSFLGVAVGSALESASGERQDVTYTMNARLKFKGYPEVEIHDFGSSPAGPPGAQDIMRAAFIKAVGKVFNNPWQHVVLEKVDVDVELKFGRDVAMLRGVELLTPEVSPGESARIRVNLSPFAGKTMTRVIAVPIPERFAGETLRLGIEPGYEVERRRSEPDSVAELLQNLENETLAPQSLVVSYETGEGGAAFRGAVAEGLPPFALDVLTSETSSFNPTQFKAEHHHVVPLPIYVIGKDHVSVKVRPKIR